jgi:hypothetical protein
MTRKNLGENDERNLKKVTIVRENSKENQGETWKERW